MLLTTEEKAILAGQKGKAKQYALDLLVRFGEIFDAERLLPIKFAHVSCTSVVIEGSLVSWLKQFLDMDAKVVVPTVSMVTGCDLRAYDAVGQTKAVDLIPEQNKLLSSLYTMGIAPTHTCAPYLLPGIPMAMGTHIASCESSAIIFWNSARGIRVYRNCCQSALCAAITGRTVAIGPHLDKNRMGTVEIEVDADLVSRVDWGLMVFDIAESLGLATPVFTGKVQHATDQDLMNMCGAFTTTSGVSMFHIVGVTPEAPTKDMAFAGNSPNRTIQYSNAKHAKIWDKVQPKQHTEVHFVYIGCPHATIQEIHEVAQLIKGQQVASHVTFWVLTNRAIKSLADSLGYTTIIETAGGHIVCDCCGSAYDQVPGDHSHDIEVTNGVKLWRRSPHHIRGVKSYLGNVKEVVLAAINGYFENTGLHD